MANLQTTSTSTPVYPKGAILVLFSMYFMFHHRYTLSCLLLSAVKPRFLNTLLPLHTTMFHQHSTPVLFAAVSSTTTVPEHTVTYAHHNVSPPLHTVLFAAVSSTATVPEHTVTYAHHNVSPPLNTVLFAAVSSKTTVPEHTVTSAHHNVSPPLHTVLFAAVSSTATVPEHIVISPHHNNSSTLHTCPVCCCQQYSHSS